MSDLAPVCLLMLGTMSSVAVWGVFLGAPDEDGDDQ